MNEQKNNNGRGIFYGVIGVATLVVAIIGATFAYFTASQSAGNNVITGNMATITFNLTVTKVTHVDETKGGMIPMSNHMVNSAVSASTPCVDDNGNAVCQIYRVDVENTGSASLFVDGYVTLTGGSGVPTDFTTWTNLTGEGATTTTMRWAQAFCTNDSDNNVTGCSTGGTVQIGSDSGVAITALAGATGTDSTADQRFARADIKTTYASITGSTTIENNTYDVINTNFIRVSDHKAETGYDRQVDPTSALVYNQYLKPSNAADGKSAKMYFVVWLSETGTDQTAGSNGAGAFQAGQANATGLEFFNGNVTFNSAQGSEVTATFQGYTAVQSDHASGQSQSSQTEPTP